MRGGDLLGVFKNSLLIMRKDYFPSLFKTSEGTTLQVSIADESSRGDWCSWC